jgi:hypothetical protein
MPDLSVRISSSKRRYGYGETVRLRARVENISTRALYLVMGRVYPAEPVAGVMEVLHGQAPCDPNAGYFAFRPPELRRLRRGQATEFEFSFAMPLHRYGLDATGHYSEWAIETSGKITLAVTLGYLLGPFRPKTDGPWGEFTRFQKMSPVRSVAVDIARP